MLQDRKRQQGLETEGRRDVDLKTHEENQESKIPWKPREGWLTISKAAETASRVNDIWLSRSFNRINSSEKGEVRGSRKHGVKGKEVVGHLRQSYEGMKMHFIMMCNKMLIVVSGSIWQNFNYFASCNRSTINMNCCNNNIKELLRKCITFYMPNKLLYAVHLS